MARDNFTGANLPQTFVLNAPKFTPVIFVVVCVIPACFLSLCAKIQLTTSTPTQCLGMSHCAAQPPAGRLAPLASRRKPPLSLRSCSTAAPSRATDQVPLLLPVRPRHGSVRLHVLVCRRFVRFTVAQYCFHVLSVRVGAARKPNTGCVMTSDVNRCYIYIRRKEDHQFCLRIKLKLTGQ